MSILRYNNGGTWEAINIDHASTADSALYDANGNVISSTYATKTELSNALAVTYGTISINFWGESSNQQWEKYGRIIHIRLMRDFASARSSYGNPGTIVTLPTNLLPRTTVRASGVAFIDNVTWGGGTYYPVVISISTAGEMAIFGNTTYMVRCVGIQAEFSYISAT